MNGEPILVVEDDDDLRQLLGMVCELHGIEAILVADASAAIAVIDSRNCDLVLTDLNLSGDHDGLEVLSAGVAKGCRVLVMSASVAVEGALLTEMGATRVVAKPFVVLSLPALIQEIKHA